MKHSRRSRPWMTMGDDELFALLLDGYCLGAFPMGEPGSETVDFYRPIERGVLPLPSGVAHTGDQRFHVPRTVERLLRSGRLAFRCDHDFAAVVAGCARERPPTREEKDGLTEAGTWINQTIVRWYTLLHRRGVAHSIEAWVEHEGESRLVGGIYGVSLGSAFFGESMFHLAQPRRPDGARDPFDGTNAGQACLVVLARHLAAIGYTLFDVQMVSSVVARFGGHTISGEEYERRLKSALDSPDRWQPLG